VSDNPEGWVTDVLTPAQRRLNMSRIRGIDTKPEMLVRRALHARGLRFRLHRTDLPGRPDLVFPAHHAVIFIHGCFWHGHGCALCKVPATRTEFWTTKIAGNKDRDALTIQRLRDAGWRVMIVWECALRGRGKLEPDGLYERCVRFVQNDRTPMREIPGRSG
jgi:DNA mismatch endonuclease (patch repair protein)